jgi:two-component system chemotaxis response regulator CheY
MNIGEVIKDRRQKRNLTQAELAGLLNVTPQAVSRWEVGVSFPDITMIPELSEVLKVTADELFGIGLTCGQVGAVLHQSQVDDIFDFVPGGATGKSRRILIVDDSAFMRKTLEDILTHHGHTVLQAENGRECLEVLRKETVDLCLLDIVMPVMSGIDALRVIREEQPQLRVVMLSAMSQEDNVRLALQLGADAFVVKPFQESSLIERIG